MFNSLRSSDKPVAVESKPEPNVSSVKSKSISIVPLPVIGEPDTSNPVPTVTATLVTVPPESPGEVNANT